MKRTIIIGSGVTGMATALLLAKQEIPQEITILEASKHPAPLLSGFMRHGLHFDTGFHCAGGLNKGGILRHWLKYLGVWEYIEDSNIYPLSEEFRFGQNPNLYHFPAEQSNLLASITEQFGIDNTKKFAKFLSQIQHVLDSSPYTNTNCMELPKLSFDNASPLLKNLEELKLHETLSQMIKARSLLYGLSPKQATLHDYAMVGGLYFNSCHGIYGSGKTLSKAFLKVLKEQNIKLCCNSQVTRIMHKNKKMHAVQLKNGNILEADQCIYTAHPSKLCTLVDAGVFRNVFHQHIADLEETVTAFIMFAESKEPYLNERAVYLLPKNPQDAIISPPNASKPTAYIVGAKHSTKVPGQGFPFMAVFPLQDNSPIDVPKPRPQEYINFKQEKSAQLQKYLENSIPELGPIHVHATATSATMQDWICGSSGSMYGVAHTISSLPLLPKTRMEGFFLAGQNILLPGILGGIVSAALAVGFASTHENVIQSFHLFANKNN